MKLHSTPIAAAFVACTAIAGAASFDFNGAVHTTDITGIPWVGPSTMWGAVDTGGGTAISQSGFAYFGTHDITKLTFSFGDLELSERLSPGPATAGYEIYRELDNSIVPFQIKYDGTVIASGDSLFLRTHVDNDQDYGATGTGQFRITSPGTDPTFYNQVMSLTAGTGLFDATISTFAAVDNLGNFGTSGVMTTAVPEPGTWAAATSLALLAFAALRRNRLPQA